LAKIHQNNMLIKENGIHFKTISSTNQYLLDNQLPHGIFVIADSQTHGRGRHNRKWYDIPQSTFLFSVVLYYKNHLEQLSYLSLITALCVIEAIHQMFRDLNLPKKNLFIKWPNDVLMLQNNTIGKLAGILIETIYNTEQYKVVIGIGLNWKGVPSIEDDKIKFPPVALFNVDFEKSTSFFIDYLFNKFNEFSIENPYDFVSYKSLIHQYHFLQHKIIKFGNKKYLVENIDDKGFLRLKDEDNKMIVINDWNEEFEIL